MSAPASSNVMRRVRDRVGRLFSAAVVATGSFAFMYAIPFLPGAPFFPLFIALGLGFLSIRAPGWASATLLVISFFSITWQMIGFGLLGLFNTTGGSALALALLAILLINPVSIKEEPAELALIFLAVATMLTPYYYLSIGLIVLAGALGGLSSLPRVSTTFVETLAPLLVMENALDFSSSAANSAKPPIIFSQLSALSSNIRPSLPGLNLYLTGMPHAFLYAHMDSVVSYLTSGEASVLIVPILLLGLAATVAVLASGVLTNRLSFLETVNEARGIRVTYAPLIGAMVGPLPFLLLILLFSLPGVGGYRDGLGLSESTFMVLGSIALSLALILKEAIIWRFERVELARDVLNEFMRRLRGLLSEGMGVINLISVSAPSVTVSKETSIIDVDRSYIDDIARGMGAANLGSLNKWVKDLRERLLPSTETLVAGLKSRVMQELERISTLATSYNNLLAEAGAPLSYSTAASSASGQQPMGMEPTIREYDRLISSVRTEAVKLYQDYITTTEAFNQLIEHAVVPPPVNPQSLFDSHDYAGGMKLVVEDYWLNFHLKYRQELTSRVRSLEDAFEGLKGLVRQAYRERIVGILGAMRDVRPAGAVGVLEQMKKLHETLVEWMEEELAAIERARRLVNSASPDAERILSVEFGPRLDTLRGLLEEIRTSRPTFEDITDFMGHARANMPQVRSEETKDDEKLIVLAQYPLAKKLIERLTRESRAVTLSSLPFQREAAVTFARLFASASSDIKFDSENEALVTRSAKVR